MRQILIYIINFILNVQHYIINSLISYFLERRRVVKRKDIIIKAKKKEEKNELTNLNLFLMISYLKRTSNIFAYRQYSGNTTSCIYFSDKNNNEYKVALQKDHFKFISVTDSISIHSRAEEKDIFSSPYSQHFTRNKDKKTLPHGVLEASHYVDKIRSIKLDMSGLKHSTLSPYKVSYDFIHNLVSYYLFDIMSVMHSNGGCVDVIKTESASFFDLYLPKMSEDLLLTDLLNMYNEIEEKCTTHRKTGRKKLELGLSKKGIAIDKDHILKSARSAAGVIWEIFTINNLVILGIEESFSVFNTDLFSKIPQEKNKSKEEKEEGEINLDECLCNPIYKGRIDIIALDTKINKLVIIDLKTLTKPYSSKGEQSDLLDEQKFCQYIVKERSIIQLHLYSSILESALTKSAIHLKSPLNTALYNEHIKSKCEIGYCMLVGIWPDKNRISTWKIERNDKEWLSFSDPSSTLEGEARRKRWKGFINPK